MGDGQAQPGAARAGPADVSTEAAILEQSVGLFGRHSNAGVSDGEPDAVRPVLPDRRHVETHLSVSREFQRVTEEVEKALAELRAIADHDADFGIDIRFQPIAVAVLADVEAGNDGRHERSDVDDIALEGGLAGDRKSTRLNSSH